MKELLKKLAKAKQVIQSENLKKNSRNDYSGYYYFSPEYVENIVQKVCTELGLYTKFDLLRDEFGEVGVLSVFDLDTEQNLTWQMASAVPVIKATNATQQLGGAVTYTERYLKMTAFGIVDNSADFDTTENTKKHNNTKKSNDSELQWLNVMDKETNFTPQWLNVVEAINNGKINSVNDVLKYYKVSKETEEKIKELLNT